jgi:hypothetical protein
MNVADSALGSARVVAWPGSGSSEGRACRAAHETQEAREEREFLRETEPSNPPTPADIERHLSHARTWGVDVDVTRLDQELYGGG